jgi:heme exporter protein C
MTVDNPATSADPGAPAAAGRPAVGSSPAPDSTGSRVTRVLGILSIVGLVALVVFGLFISPPDAKLGETIRILYMHVPTVSAAYVAFVITAIGSAMYLWKRTEFWDLLAASSAEIGVLFFALTIFNGMLWGKITWGVFWRWEPRLTTTAVLFLTYLGYLAVRQIPNDTRTRGTVSAVIGLMAVVNIPIVHKAVDWWRGLHQEKTIFGTVNPDMHGTQLFTAYLGLTVFMVLFAWLLIHRFRVAWLAERAADVGVDAAILERRAEGAAPVAPRTNGEVAP